MNHTIIISGFAGVGKSTLEKKPNLKVLDLDSSAFTWCPGAPSCPNTSRPYKKFRNHNFKYDYINAIISAYKSQKYHYIFVSTHEETRQLLNANNIPFTLVYPSIDRKEEFTENYIRRGNTDALIKYLTENWNTLITNLKNDTYSNQKIEMTSGYLDDYINKITKYYNKGGKSRNNKKNKRKSKKHNK